VERQIKDHAQKLIKNILEITKGKISDLRQEKKEVMRLVEDRKYEIKRRIKILKDIKEQTIFNFARPNFNEIGEFDNTVDKMRNFPFESKVTIDDYEPGDIDIETLEKEFGNLPYFENKKMQEHSLETAVLWDSGRKSRSFGSIFRKKSGVWGLENDLESTWKSELMRIEHRTRKIELQGLDDSLQYTFGN
jgi:hypothetical protein